MLRTFITMFSISTKFASLAVVLLLAALLPSAHGSPTPGLLGAILPADGTSTTPGLLPRIPILDALLALGASPPPKQLQSVNPSPECAAINGGELQCCRAMVAGDVQLVTWIAHVYGYELNPNDVNGLNCM
jgi:hypothetical protein